MKGRYRVYVGDTDDVSRAIRTEAVLVGTVEECTRTVDRLRGDLGLWDGLTIHLIEERENDE